MWFIAYIICVKLILCVIIFFFFLLCIIFFFFTKIFIVVYSKNNRLFSTSKILNFPNISGATNNITMQVLAKHPTNLRYTELNCYSNEP